MRSELEPFVEQVPWLRDVGDEMLARLDAGDWVLPSGELAARRAELERQLEAYVMTYRREAEGLRDALAALLEPAPLTGEQMSLLSEVENQLGNCLLVAYARPLKKRGEPGRGRRSGGWRRASPAKE